MAYRSETTRLQARVEDLTEELDVARLTIQRLKGDERRSRPFLDRTLGGSATVVIDRQLEGRLDETQLAEVHEVLARRFDAQGELVRIGHRFAWSLPKTFEHSRNVDITLVERDGHVHLSVRERVARLGVVGYALLIGVMLPFAFMTAACYTHLPSFAFVLPLFVLSIVAARAAFRVWFKHRERNMLAVCEDITAIFDAQDKDPSRARIAPRAVDVGQAEVEAEADREAMAEVSGAAEVNPPALRPRQAGR